jgi:hypothetical protein
VEPVTTDTYIAVLEGGIPEEIQEVLKKKELVSDDSRTRCSHDEDLAGEGVPAATAASFPENLSLSLRRTLVLMVLNYFQAGQFYGLLSWLPTLLISRSFTMFRRLRSL